MKVEAPIPALHVHEIITPLRCLSILHLHPHRACHLSLFHCGLQPGEGAECSGFRFLLSLPLSSLILRPHRRSPYNHKQSSRWWQFCLLQHHCFPPPSWYRKEGYAILVAMIMVWTYGEYLFRISIQLIAVKCSVLRVMPRDTLITSHINSCRQPSPPI